MENRKELAKAIHNGKTNKVIKILNKHPKLLNEGLDEDGCPALHIAAKKNQLEIIGALLKIPGIDKYASNKYHKPAFMEGGWSSLFCYHYLLDLISEFESSKELSSLTKERMEYLKKNDEKYFQHSPFYILTQFIDANSGAIAVFTELKKKEPFNEFNTPRYLSYYLLAILYRLGKGTPCNIEMAASYFFKAYQAIQRVKITTSIENSFSGS